MSAQDLCDINKYLRNEIELKATWSLTNCCYVNFNYYSILHNQSAFLEWFIMTTTKLKLTQLN